MQPIHVITLGVSDIARSRKFYEEGLGFKAHSSSNEHFVVFDCRGVLLALFGEMQLAKDAARDFAKPGFRGVTLAHNVTTKEEVVQLLQKAESIGAKITKKAQDVFWGGYSGYFADPDGHLWEVAWNPHWGLSKDGFIQLPNKV